MAQDTPEYEIQDLEVQLGTNEFTGNLSSGKLMPLRWAANSSVACFPATRFVEFKGNHVLYRMEMPKYSSLRITVIPKNKKARTNVYALRLGINNYDNPPNISSCISCEAGYPIYVGTPSPRMPAKPQSVEYISVNRPYNILIGVAGIEGVVEGEYTLKIELASR